MKEVGKRELAVGSWQGDLFIFGVYRYFVDNDVLAGKGKREIRINTKEVESDIETNVLNIEATLKSHLI